MIADTTDLLFPMIRDAAKRAEAKLIDGKRCFVIPEADFLKIMSIFFLSNHDYTFDPRIAAEGFDNVLIQVSSLDNSAYYLCAKCEPYLDKLWQDKAPTLK